MADSSKQPELEQPLPTLSVQEIASQKQWFGNLSYEDPIDKKHRLEQEVADSKHKRDLESANARHNRWRSTTLFAATLVGLVFVFGFCMQIVSNAKATPDDKKWATAVMTSIVTGSVGFVTGKAIS